MPAFLSISEIYLSLFSIFYFYEASYTDVYINMNIQLEESTSLQLLPSAGTVVSQQTKDRNPKLCPPTAFSLESLIETHTRIHTPTPTHTLNSDII